MDIFDVCALAGALALFLFGMDGLGKAIERQAGSRMQALLPRAASDPFKGFLMGAALTAALQSSGRFITMVVSFVNSGLMGLHNAVGVVLGSNVGTTATAWVLGLAVPQGEGFWARLCSAEGLVPLLAFAGIVLHLYARSEKRQGAGAILLYFAVLMAGMRAMAAALTAFAGEAWFARALGAAAAHPLLGLAAGMAVAAAVRSSTAAVGILQALAATGALGAGTAVPMVLGMNIGMCIPVLAASAGANQNARRTAAVHLYFNLIGAALLGAGFYALNAALGFGFLQAAATPLGVAGLHTAFNLIAAMLLLPCTGLLERLALRTIPDGAQPERFQLLDARLLEQPALAVRRAQSVAGAMATLCRESMLRAMSLTHRWDEALAAQVQSDEARIDAYEDRLGSYLVALSGRALSSADGRATSILLHTIGDFERIGDHAMNLAKTAREIHEKRIAFSPAAQHELRVLERAVQDLIDRAIAAFESGDAAQAARVEPLEQVVDELVREMKDRHVERLQSGGCTIEMGFIWQDLLTDYERAADHCSNIAVAMIELPHGTFDTHAYLGRVKEEKDAAYRTQEQADRKRYALEREDAR